MVPLGIARDKDSLMTTVLTAAQDAADQGEPSVVRLGARIRALRRTRGMTLVQVAERAGLSHPFLSQLERGLTGPSMGSLERIALALGTSQVELLADDDPRRMRSLLVREHEGNVGPYGLGTARMLAPPTLSFTPLELVADNVDRGAMHAHSEAEFLVVLDGRIGIDVGDDTHELGVGDSMSIAPDAPHRWWSTSGARYRLLVVKEGVRAGALGGPLGLDEADRDAAGAAG
jgi:transcriptional regulator with XRE-family HTH domain